MSDIVELLLEKPNRYELKHGIDAETTRIWHKLCVDAADEIERLRAVVDAVRDECEKAGTVANRMATPDAAAATLVLADRILCVLDGEP